MNKSLFFLVTILLVFGTLKLDSLRESSAGANYAFIGLLGAYAICVAWCISGSFQRFLGNRQSP